jgi:hypothetical protein
VESDRGYGSAEFPDGTGTTSCSADTKKEAHSGYESEWAELLVGSIELAAKAEAGAGWRAVRVACGRNTTTVAADSESRKAVSVVSGWAQSTRFQPL